MRKLFTLIVLFITCLSANAQLTNGLVAHWNFNGTVNDFSGNSLNGTPTNITYTTGKTGVANTAADFNGTSSVINVPYDSKMNVTQFSVCAIVKFDDFYAGSCQHSMILQRGTNISNGSYSLSIFENAYDNGNCSYYDPNKMVFHQKVANKESGIPLDSFKHNPNVKKNQWYCVVATHDGFRIRVYVDGVQMLSYSSTNSFGTSSEKISIGANAFGNGSQYPYWLNGAIDDLRLYNRVLSPSEINSYCSLFDTTVAIKDSIDKKNLCMDDTLHLSYTVSNQFGGGNIFTAQLSNASGSFASPVNIGTLTSSGNGTIICNIPTVTAGNGYRVRVVSSNPVRTSDVSLPFGIYTAVTPAVSITATPNGVVPAGQYITFVAAATNAGPTPTYQWYRNGLPIQAATDDSLYINTLNDGDSIYVVVFSSSPCSDSLSGKSNVVAVKISSSVSNIRLDNLSLYPNPNSGNFTVSATGIEHDAVSIEIINATGQIISKKEVMITDARLNERIVFDNAGNGVYLLRITANGEHRNIRFVVSK